MTSDVEHKWDLPDSWVWTKLKEICETSSGGTPNRKIQRYYEGDIPWIKSGELKDNIILSSEEFISNLALKESSAKLFPKDTLLIAMYGATVGKLGFLGIEAATNQAICAIFPPEGLSKRFLFWFLKNVRNELLNARIGGAQPNISQTIVRNLGIPIPPLPEQHRIVNKIDELSTKLDAGIEGLNRVKAQLKRYRQAVLKYAFEGKLTEEWRTQNIHRIGHSSALLETIRKERKNKYEGKVKKLPPLDISNLPVLPDGWVWARVGEISEGIRYGYTAKASSEPIGTKFLRITDIQDNTVDWDSVPFCQIEDSAKKKYLLKKRDLVFARTGATVGKSFLIKSDIPEAVFASYLIRIELFDNIDEAYVSAFFHSPQYWLQIYQGQAGIGQPNVNAQILSRLIIPLAPITEQRKIVNEVERHLSIIDEANNVIEKGFRQSNRLRQGILQKAFTGKLVPQDPSDEPAEKLLERIKSEKKKTTKRIRKVNI